MQNPLEAFGRRHSRTRRGFVAFYDISFPRIILMGIQRRYALGAYSLMDCRSRKPADCLRNCKGRDESLLERDLVPLALAGSSRLVTAHNIIIAHLRRYLARGRESWTKSGVGVIFLNYRVIRVSFGRRGWKRPCRR